MSKIPKATNPKPRLNNAQLGESGCASIRNYYVKRLEILRKMNDSVELDISHTNQVRGRIAEAKKILGILEP